MAALGIYQSRFILIMAGVNTLYRGFTPVHLQLPEFSPSPTGVKDRFP